MNPFIAGPWAFFVGWAVYTTVILPAELMAPFAPTPAKRPPSKEVGGPTWHLNKIV